MIPTSKVGNASDNKGKFHHTSYQPNFTTTAKPVEDKMAMLDWNDYRNQILTRVGEIGKLTPDTVKGYAMLGGAGAKTGHLDAKTRELVALAVAITLRCDGCIGVHAAAARKLGASKEEIAEALGVGISVNAGAALVYSSRTLDAFDAAA
jgi:AhpD family alkylhydroperoxidase